MPPTFRLHYVAEDTAARVAGKCNPSWPSSSSQTLWSNCRNHMLHFGISDRITRAEVMNLALVEEGEFIDARCNHLTDALIHDFDADSGVLGSWF